MLQILENPVRASAAAPPWGRHYCLPFRSGRQECLPHAGRRRGFVILAVLMIVVIMALLAWRYADLMTEQYRSAVNSLRITQVRALAEAGVHYTAMQLKKPKTTTDLLNLNPYNNKDIFSAQLVHEPPDGSKGYFSVIAPSWGAQLLSQGQYNFGVMDESSKININAVMKADPTGDTLYQLLSALPNMTTDLAARIVDWVDPDDQTSTSNQSKIQRPGGAESNDYTPNAVKNGPLDSLDELLMIPGITPELLYGGDQNRNGMIDQDQGETATDGSNPLGWSAYLTTYSREQNLASDYSPRVFVNSGPLPDLQQQLTEVVDASLATYIVLYRYYGGKAVATSSSGKSTSKTSSTLNVASSIPAGVDLSNPKSLTKIKSLYDLINTQVTVPADAKDKNSKAQVFDCPLNNSDGVQSLLPQLLDKCTASQDQELPARINILTAPEAVIRALATLSPSGSSSSSSGSSSSGSSSSGSSSSGSSGKTGGSTSKTSSSGTSSSQATQGLLSDTDIQSILSSRPAPGDANFGSPAYQTPTWLISQGGLKASTLKSLEKYIACTTQVYRFQVVGYFDPPGPTARVEAVVDLNAGRPRILHFRDLTLLGKGFDLSQGK